MNGQKVSSDLYDLMLSNLLDHSVAEISVEQAEEFSHAYWLDTRSPEEFEVSHIPGAIFAGYDSFEEETLNQFDQSDTLIFYCSVGLRSEKIAEKAKAAGFDHVYNLYGGIFEWVNQSKPVRNEQGLTMDIHPYNWVWGQWLKRGRKVRK